MNSGVFIGGTSSNLQPQQHHSNSKHLHHNNTTCSNHPSTQQQQQQVASSKSRGISQQQPQQQHQQTTSLTTTSTDHHHNKQQHQRSSNSSHHHNSMHQHTLGSGAHHQQQQTRQSQAADDCALDGGLPPQQQRRTKTQYLLAMQQQQEHEGAASAESNYRQSVINSNNGSSTSYSNTTQHEVIQSDMVVLRQQQQAAQQQQQLMMQQHKLAGGNPQIQSNAAAIMTMSSSSASQQQQQQANNMIAARVAQQQQHNHHHQIHQQGTHPHHQQHQQQQQQQYVVTQQQQHHDGGQQQIQQQQQQQHPHATYNSKAQTHKVVMMQGVSAAGPGQKGVRALASANSYKQNQQHPSQQTQQQLHHQQMQQQQQQLRVQLQGQAASAGTALSPNTATTGGNGGLRPGSNHRVLVPVKQQAPQPQQQQAVEIVLISGQDGRQPTATSQGGAGSAAGTSITDQSQTASQQHQIIQSSSQSIGGSNPPGTALNAPTATDGSTASTKAPPRTYKEIRQRLHQQQQMHQLRLQQQQWIARQQQILLTNNPGATIEQVNAIIQQSIINQQQQMALQQQQQAAHQMQALQQATNVMQAQQQQVVMANSQSSGGPQNSTAQNSTAVAQQQQQMINLEGGAGHGHHPNQASQMAQNQASAVFPNGSISSAQHEAGSGEQADEQHYHHHQHLHAQKNLEQQQILLQQQQQQQQLRQQQQPQIVRLSKRQTGNLVGAPQNSSSVAATAAAQQQVQIKQLANGQMSISAAGATAASQQQQVQNLMAAQLPISQNSHQHPRNLLVSSQQNLPSAATSVSASVVHKAPVKDENLMSYAQLLKQECQYEGGPSAPSLNYKPNQLQQNLQPTNLPHENLKHTLQQLTSEILRKVLARSDSMNQLRQIIDLKAKKVKPKNYESSIFQTIMDKEQTRVKQEADSLAKQGLRVEDKTLIKYLRGQVKKMLKPFRGLQYDDYLNNEIHLNEIMATQDQQNDPIKESRKRHLRILDAALKEQVVDIHIVLGICVQISRQAFYNELQEYFVCAYDYIMANQAQFQQHDIQGITNLKKKLGSVRSNSKVQIQTTKKLDRMFWLLLEQNQEVRNNIRTYKERYAEKTENGGNGSRFQDNDGGSSSAHGGHQHLNSASHLQRRHNNNLRSSSGINNGASPKVSAGGSSHNIFSSQNNQKGGQDGSMRRTVQKGGARTSSHQQETYNGGNSGGGAGGTAGGAGSTTGSKQQTTGGGGSKSLHNYSQDNANEGAVNLHATAGKAQQLLYNKNSSGKNSQLAPIPANGKKAQSLIQKKMKARDLDRQLNCQPTPASAAEKTPEHSGVTKKRRMSSTKAGQNQLLSAHSQHQSATPQNFHPRSRTKHLTVINSTNNGAGQQTSNNNNISSQQQNQHQYHGNGSGAQHHGSTTSNNSTENLFNLIQETKKKNTMILEPLAKRHNKNESHGPQLAAAMDPRDEIGSGLHSGSHPDRVSVPMSSQKSHRMRQTDYSRGFMSNLDMDQQQLHQHVATAEMDPEQVVQLAAASHQHQQHLNQHAKVFRSWSRPQIGDQSVGGSKSHQQNVGTTESSASNAAVGGIGQQDGSKLFNNTVGGAGKVLKTTQMQVCTCARFRKRIEPPMADISVAPLVSASKTSNLERGSMAKANTQTAKSDLGNMSSPDHPRLRNSSKVEEVIAAGAIGLTSPAKPDTSAKSEYKGGRKLHNQEEMINAAVSPHDRKNQPRASQDFKMRILTKKKVAVPASATSQSRSQFNQSNASSASLEPNHNQIGPPNRQTSAESAGVGAGTNHQAVAAEQHVSSFSSDNNATSMLQRSKIVTYELCQDCGGQRPAGLPQVTSSLSEIKVKLQVGKVSAGGGGYHSSNDEEFPGTARLNDSGRSSTLSIGNRGEDGKRSSSSAKHRSQVLLNQYVPNANDPNNQALLGQNIKLERIKANLAVEKCLNKRYLMALGIQYYPGLQEFIVNSRAMRIQSFLQDRLEIKIFAAQIIQSRWRLHKMSLERLQMRRAKLQHLRKKVAINRIYDVHRLIKVRKVTANSQLIQHQLWQQVQQSQETLGDTYLTRIILIQRRWRAILARKYLMGKALLAKKHTKQRIWNQVIAHKYRKTQCLESWLTSTEIMFIREKKNLEGYFWKQMVGYAKDLETRAAKIEQRLNADFVLADWSFDAQAREWQNSMKSMTIKLEKHEPSQVTILRDKLVKFYVSNQLPSEAAINKNLDEFQDGRNAMQKALKKDQDYKKRHMLQRIKRQRLQNLFEEEPDILVEHV